MHDHKKCNHTLRFCEHCDVVYCTKCEAEWKKSGSTITWTGGGSQTTPAPYPYNAPGISGGITLCSSNNHNHEKNND